MEWLYSRRDFRKIRIVGDHITYEVWSTGFFPHYLFSGRVPREDFLNFIAETN